MFLFIFESIGTAELLVIGIVALIFLGPRKMPEMARKIGKIMADFRNTTGEFKETWEREVNFDEEVKALNLDDDNSVAVPRKQSNSEVDAKDDIAAPTIREIDPASFREQSGEAEAEPAKVDPIVDVNDKKHWL